MYPYELQKGSKKHACPICGKRTFVRVVEAATGRYLPDHVGRCDRESNCGYQYTWKEYFADNPEENTERIGHLKKKGIPKPAFASRNCSYGVSEASLSKKKPDYLDIDHLTDTIGNYDQNTFVQFLLKLFPNDPGNVIQTVKEYRIGTKEGFTVFPTINKIRKVCKAKLIKFDQAGHSIKYPNGKRAVSSLEYYLKKEGKLNEDFETDKNVFFGEHRLQKNEGLPIAIVEAEKTAVLASICKGAFPDDLVWLAAGSKQWLKVERLKRLGQDRRIILYPDADGFDKWQSIALDASKRGLTVKVSDLIEKRATGDQKAKQVDLADYLISEQQKRNDPANREAFRDLIEERLAIMTLDGGLSEKQAEAEIIDSGFYRNAIRALLDSA